MREFAHAAGRFLRDQPLVAAAGFFLLGVGLGSFAMPFDGAALAVMIAAWCVWILAELRGWRGVAHAMLGVALLAGGTLVWNINQHHVERDHVALLAGQGETMVVLRAEATAPPADPHARGNHYWMARALQISTEQGWRNATGDVLVEWNADDDTVLARGTKVELYGWIRRPASALNPGAFDPRAALAADRVFAQLRVPRPSGVVILSASTNPKSESWLERMRAFLRGKLLEHLIQDDVPAAYTLNALLLGHREPAIDDISQAFADAGVAHLLAISGSHIVFFAALAWLLLRWVPMRPRLRELVIAAVVGAYVLATPCGPPIVRAAVALFLVVAARMIGRPRAYLNILAAAAIVVVLLRPADLRDAGFQLSFVTTAGLILFSGRVHEALFGTWFTQQHLIAELRASHWLRRKIWVAKIITGILVANLIGAITAGPLVAYHFGQVNLWAVITGLLALPAVTLSMVMAALQLLLELASSSLGAALSPLTAWAGNLMIATVRYFANLPGAAMPVRPPPAWTVAAMYGVVMLWAMRRPLGFSRAMVTNCAITTCAIVAGWYALTTPVGRLEMTVCNAGADGSCILIRTPRGDMWAINAGGVLGRSLMSSAVKPSLRLAGERRLGGLVLTSLDGPHARYAGRIIDECHPAQIALADAAWSRRNETLEGWTVQTTAQRTGASLLTLHAGKILDLGNGCTIETLWPPADSDSAAGDLILLITFEQHRILVAHPRTLPALTLIRDQRPALAADTAILTGPQRGTADLPLQRLLTELGVRSTIWCGRGAWAPRDNLPGQLNVTEGAALLSADRTGMRLRHVD